MTKITFTAPAYCKMIMHSAKYPHCAINGVLLAASNKNDDSKSILCVDAIPLFHVCLHVTPMAEIALSQISSWAESNGLVIAGYYLANETFNDISHDRPAHRIADKISEKNPNSCLVVIENRLVTLSHNTSAIHAYRFTGGKWELQDKTSGVEVDDDTLLKTSALLKNRRYYELTDFDNHLDNISLDWKNLQLNKEIVNSSSDS